MKYICNIAIIDELKQAVVEGLKAKNPVTIQRQICRIFTGRVCIKQSVIAVCLIMASAGFVAGPVLAQPPMPGAVYIEPAYPIPGPGYVWMNHPRYGWGWHHPRYGWHKRWGYVARPVYPIPGPGYVWRSHPRYGMGWYHPRYGWHRGWR
jgi:hypothetical protein